MMKTTFSYRKLTVVCAVVIIMLAQIVTTSVATPSSATTPAFVDTDLDTESRTLDTFVDDLGKFDKHGRELGKKASLTAAELDLHERTANDLKRRVSGVQSALGAMVRKLKAAGQWNDLDEIVLAKVGDSNFQDFVRREGFKKTLEELSSGLSNNTNELINPLDALRNRVKAQAQDPSFGPANSILAPRLVRVGYTTAPVMFATNAKCRLAQLRRGFGAAFSKSGRPSPHAANAVGCYCSGNQESCDAL
jgi:hypothetical protein